MTITLVTNDNVPEGQFAQRLGELIRSDWPWIEESPDSHIVIHAPMVCNGRTRDLDIVLLADLGDPRESWTFRLPVYRADGTRFRGKVSARGLCLVIELKTHGPEGYEVRGTQVRVKYTSGWDEVTDRSQKQRFALGTCFQQHGIQHGCVPQITNILWFPNGRAEDFDPLRLLFWRAGHTWSEMLDVVARAELSADRRDPAPDVTVLDSFRTPSNSSRTEYFESLAKPLLHRTKPTRLDRERMEMIAAAAASDELLDRLGSGQIRLCGQGGTGKTIALLQLALAAFRRRQQRTIVLTYNRVLAANLSRLLAFLSVDPHSAMESPREGDLRVATIHVFFHEVFAELGLGLPSGGDLDQAAHERLVAEAAKLLEGGHQVPAVANRYDFVAVDEAQDMPPGEKALLRKLFPPERTVVSDGIDQLVRGSRCDWDVDILREKRAVHELPTCRRMKSNLAAFVSALARELAYPWTARPCEEALGGRVIVVDGDYVSCEGLHRRLLEDNKGSGNEPVDMLFCVPWSRTRKDEATGESRARDADVFQTWGHEILDLTQASRRDDFPSSPAQLRLVPYDSCRGLEGWTTVLLGADSYLDWRIRQGDGTDASAVAVRWFMIAATRAIDTLVITLDKPHGRLREALVSIGNSHPDIVEWIRP